ncbi:type IV conjugative transfer system lipoprotein TraV [Rhodovastum atsumiense]|nr:type IV conjugative transfer system lipoprotein TraV [Rhodovastum atsumiense]
MLTTSVLALAGCGTVFPYESTGSCPQMGTGVCGSVRQVYEATNNRDHVNAGEIAPDAGGGEPSASSGPTVGTAGGQPHPPTPSAASLHVLPVALAGDGTLPLRSPPEIMRIWVAPWEDDKGDLMMSGYIFTELRERRWQIGSRPVVAFGGLRPVDVTAPSRAGTPAEKPGQMPPPSQRQMDAERRPDVPPVRPVAAAAGGMQPAAPSGGFWQTAPDASRVR